MGVHVVHTREEVHTEMDIYEPPYIAHKAPKIAPCSHIGVKFSTVRITCTGSVLKVCPRCGEAVQ